LNSETRLPLYGPTIRFGEYVIDPQSLRLLRGMDVIHTTAKQLELLSLLLEARGEVVSRITLMDRLWRDAEVEEHNITQTIFRLRRVLGKLPDGKEYIETVPRRGYRMSSASLTQSPLQYCQYVENIRTNIDLAAAEQKEVAHAKLHHEDFVPLFPWQRAFGWIISVFTRVPSRAGT